METIQFGQHDEIPVYPQKWAYLSNRTTKTVATVLASSENIGDLSGSILDWAGDSTYKLLVALIPTIGKRVPEYEFHGFHSKEAWENGEYDEDNDPSPTLPEIVNAFEVGVRVNRFDLLKILKTFIDPEELKGPLTKRLVSAISTDSPNSQQLSGTSELTNSTMTPQTSTENGDSHLNGSTPSSIHTLEDEVES